MCVVRFIQSSNLPPFPPHFDWPTSMAWEGRADSQNGASVLRCECRLGCCSFDVGGTVAEAFGTDRSFRDDTMKNCSHGSAGKLKIKKRIVLPNSPQIEKCMSVRIRRKSKQSHSFCKKHLPFYNVQCETWGKKYLKRWCESKIVKQPSKDVFSFLLMYKC